MAGTIATRKTLIGDLVKGEALISDNYENSVQTLTMTTDMEIGTCFNPADGTVVVAADIGTITGVWILVDSKTYTTVTASGDYPLAVMEGGPGGSGYAIVVREELKFGDTLTSGNIDSVVALIEAQGIKVVNNDQ